MSKECGFEVNGQKSPLYDKILEAYNGIEELAIPLHSYFRTNEKFLKDFSGSEIAVYDVAKEFINLGFSVTIGSFTFISPLKDLFVELDCNFIKLNLYANAYFF